MAYNITLPAFLIAAFCVSLAYADKTYTVNKLANKKYEQEDYAGALDLYDKALLENPDEQKLRMNKGNALFKLGKYDKAAEAYGEIDELDDKNVLADMHYNRGTILFKTAEQKAKSGQQDGVLETLKQAKEEFIQALDNRSTDRDAKWNLQLTQEIIKKLEEQQQQQNQDQDQQNKDQQKQEQQNNEQKNKDNQQQNQNQQNQQNNKQEKPFQKDSPGACCLLIQLHR